MNGGNLLDIPEPGAAEFFETLSEGRTTRIERIVSRGHASPPGFWYDQAQAEWVMVVRGKAALLFQDEPEPRILEPGDWVDIPAHVRHRVQWTDPDQETVWLAVFHDDEAPV